jgi:acetyl esterase/lipase
VFVCVRLSTCVGRFGTLFFRQTLACRRGRLFADIISTLRTRGSWSAPLRSICVPVPSLILHIAGHPDTGAQARRLAAVLRAAGISAKVVAGRETTHASINDNIGAADDPVTAEVFAFVAQVLKR